MEVRPSWSPAEWAQVSGAATTAGLAVATWATDVLGGVLGVGPGPGRCTQRSQLWRALHERWQSMFWAAFALRPQVPPEVWPQVGEIVGRGGLLIGDQAEDVAQLERRRAAEVTGAVSTMLDMLGPGARRRAAGLAAATGEHLGRRRAKLLLTPSVHEALIRSALGRGWIVSDYAGAATATAAGLMLADTRAAIETALLQQCLTDSRAAAARLAGHVADDAVEITAAEWDAIVGELARIEALIRQAVAARAPTDTAPADTTSADRDSAEVAVDVRAAIPGVFVTLGWAARWGVSGP